ncbi:MAG TPA: lytic murein transglycosylase [Candidatus Acidoferrales bacterium]|nr:lytic murein transglycosylase [Candidatus Acidoferrales bacterium]
MYAKEALAKTGVRPAIILGVLSEESDLGTNLGSGSWRTDMNPTRDAPLFQQICAEFGYNPDNQPVSKKPWSGWRGAMGPAQFIPSTWVQCARSMGSGHGNLRRRDAYGRQRRRSAERLAALRYLAGWKNAKKSAYSYYGDAVVNLAEQFQQQINVLGG